MVENADLHATLCMMSPMVFLIGCVHRVVWRIQHRSGLRDAITLILGNSHYIDERLRCIGATAKAID